MNGSAAPVTAFALAAAFVLAGCAVPGASADGGPGVPPGDSAITSPTEPASPNGPTPQTASPTPSTAPSLLPLEVGSVSVDEIRSLLESGCGVQLTRGEEVDGDGFAFYEGEDKALMRVDGSLVEFTHEGDSTLAEPESRTLAAAENGYIVTVDTPLGPDVEGRDGVAIEQATVTVRSADGPVVTFAASGGFGC